MDFSALHSLRNVLGRVRRTFFIGVRAPWTLASEKVWDAMRRFAGRMFVLAGLVILGGALLVSVFYSLAYYKRLERRSEL